MSASAHQPAVGNRLDILQFATLVLQTGSTASLGAVSCTTLLLYSYSVTRLQVSPCCQAQIVLAALVQDVSSLTIPRDTCSASIRQGASSVNCQMLQDDRHVAGNTL